jgi:hypothetical protein
MSTLDSLLVATQEMEVSLRALEQQNKELSDQLLEKEILLNIAHKELELVQRQLDSKDVRKGG